MVLRHPYWYEVLEVVTKHLGKLPLCYTHSIAMDTGKVEANVCGGGPVSSPGR